MNDLKKYLKKQLENPEFKAEYDNSRAEFEVVQAVIKARMELNMTQKELAEKTGIRQSNISRIESGASLPNLATLEVIARGLGKRLHIEFR
ncbi:MAG: helix-turn-helix transcriptional regulator [Eubacteriales bacterium]|nr:helix-turn-helix transcriptional regulator [Eubacteriales bacterium]